MNEEPRGPDPECHVHLFRVLHVFLDLVLPLLPHVQLLQPVPGKSPLPELPDVVVPPTPSVLDRVNPGGTGVSSVIVGDGGPSGTHVGGGLGPPKVPSRGQGPRDGRRVGTRVPTEGPGPRR